MSLNEIMEFDHVIQVHADGSITDAPDSVRGPEGIYDDELSDDGTWDLMNGYSGQDRYAGPIMHNSEFIGGRMERDIRDTPGYYVALVAHWSSEDGGDPRNGVENDELYDEGWAVAFKEAS